MSRVLVDTNVIISAFLFPNSTPARALALVLGEHRLVLSRWVIDELHEVVERKWPDRGPALDGFFLSLDLDRPQILTDRGFLDAYAGQDPTN